MQREHYYQENPLWSLIVELPPTRRIAAPRSRRRVWWISFALFALLGVLWATALPLFAGPDEPAHITRAVSVERGQWLGDKIPRTNGGWRAIDIPEVVVSSASFACYVFHNEVTADCLKYQGSERVVRSDTPAGTYFPGYYLIVAIPSLISVQAFGIYLMRYLSALLCAALLASALASVRSFPNARIGAVGLAVAVTPVVLFINGTVNPQSLEISAAIAAWASVLALVAKPAEMGVDRRLIVRIAVAFSALGLSRNFAPIWIAAILGAACFVAGMPIVKRWVRDRAIQIAALVIGISTLSQILWNLLIAPLDTGQSPAKASFANLVPGGLSNLSRFELMRMTIARSGYFFNSMIGDFGWVGFKSPYAVIVLWTAVIGLVLALALAVSSRRRAVVLLLIAATTTLLPLLIEYRTMRSLGGVWQGRYTLPLAVGVPILGAYLIGDSSIGNRLARSRLALVVGIALGVGHVLAFAQSLRRFSVGNNGAFKYWSNAAWAPPLGALPLTLTFIAVLSIWLVWMLRPAPDQLLPQFQNVMSANR